jgi:hypothetical protein
MVLQIRSKPAPMTISPLIHRTLPWLLIALTAPLSPAVAVPDTPDCPPTGDFGFVCGPINAEDLVQVPGTDWIIASGMAEGAAIYLIDAQAKTWSEMYPGAAPRARQDMARYGSCPGAPDPEAFVTHGLHLRPAADGHSTLYVVGHGGREAIEVFAVEASDSRPKLTWTGCVMLPPGMAANSVTSDKGGSLFATVPLHPGNTIADAMAGKPTGAIHRWSPGEMEFTLIRGTELPYPNGVELSADGERIFVASSGLSKIIAYSNSNPAQRLQSTATLPFIPDNLHAGPDGSLITAGLLADDERCGNVHSTGVFDLEAFAACPRPFVARAFEPESLAGRDLLRSSAIPSFSNVTMALPLGGEVWIGTFAGDRVAYYSLAPKD